MTILLFQYSKPKGMILNGQMASAFFYSHKLCFPSSLEMLTDLMLPGVVPQNGGLPQLSKGQLCAVALVGNQAAVAIGRASMATVDMVANGMKGRGVQVIHCFKDMLW